MINSRKIFKYTLLFAFLLIFIGFAVIYGYIGRMYESPQDERALGNADVSGLFINTEDELNYSSDINYILCFGVAEYNLADTIAILVLNYEEKKVNVINIPRDTYLYTPGRGEAIHSKINSYYQGENEAKSSASLLKACSRIMGIDFKNYIRVEYKGVENFINRIGGVDINVPFTMIYDDNPENLHIFFKKGWNHMNGSDSVKYLRYRMNNNSMNSEGDLGRIERQQDFIKAVISKIINENKFKEAVPAAVENVKTNIRPDELIKIMMNFSKMDFDDINFKTLDGYAENRYGVNFFFTDYNKNYDMIKNLK